MHPTPGTGGARFPPHDWARLNGSQTLEAATGAYQEAERRAEASLGADAREAFTIALAGWSDCVSREFSSMFLPVAVLESALRKMGAASRTSASDTESGLAIVEASLAGLKPHAEFRARAATQRILRALEMARTCQVSRDLGRVLPAAGETHCGGTGPVFLTSRHATWVYKPLSGDPSTLLSRLVQSHINPGLKHRIACSKAVRSAGGSSLYAYVQNSNELAKPEDLERFAYACGALLAICYGLRVTDMHHENLIVSDGLPVIIDHETILYRDPISPPTRPSVRHTGLLNQAGTGGLLGHEQHTGPATALGQREGQSGPHLAYGVPVESRAHCAYFEGARVRLENLEESVVEGFEGAYRQIMLRSEDIYQDAAEVIRTTNPRVRCIIRATRMYLNALRWRYQPGDIKERLGSFRERLIVHEMTGEPVSGRIVDSELEAIESGDVPYFFGCLADRHLRDQHGLVHEDFFAQTGAEEIRESLNGLTQSDCAFQVADIRRVLAEQRAASGQSASSPES